MRSKYRFVSGKPLVSFVAADDRMRFRDRLTRLAREETGDWRATVQPRGRDPVPVTVSVAVGRDARGAVQELRWLLWPAADADLGAGAAVPVMPAPEPPTVPPGLDDLAATLHEVADAAALLVRADGAGLMLADQAGALRWVTATGEAEQAFERAQRDLSVPVGLAGDILGTCNAITHSPRGWTDADAAPSWPSGP